ncbi:MAG TPA: nuclear transport factor 2 family protein [Burkholderiales bacterium]|nr:nuclear transport factor 2 family protein [Burkholderiales bacterium]
MSAADNCKLAEELFARLSAGDVAATTREKLGRLFNAMLGQLKSGLRMTVKGMIAEGDKLALEAESYGELKNGRVYNQHYSFVIEFRGGKISAVREYLDTQHAHAVWYEGAERR